MFTISYNSITQLTGILLLILVTASLFWCGDLDCFDEDGKESCGSLACALFKSQNTQGDQQSASFSSTECACVCHVPTVTAQIMAGIPNLSGQTLSVSIKIHPPSTPKNPIFHPPVPA